jgi:hypothetical protein
VILQYPFRNVRAHKRAQFADQAVFQLQPHGGGIELQTACVTQNDLHVTNKRQRRYAVVMQ